MEAAALVSDWDPALYRRFEAERNRPAADLLARVPLDAARLVVDLGCGPGNSTTLLAERFTSARVLGVDTSEAMLESARKRIPDAQFVRGNAADWVPHATSSAPDLIIANAVFHWVPDHARLLPRLLGLLAPGGVLAVQMPDNEAESTHTSMQAVAAEAPFANAIAADRGVRTALLDSTGYYDVLATSAASVDVWRTTYHHPMPSPRAIVDWFRSTGLKPWLDRLPEALHASYLAAYEARIDAAYPVRGDGSRLLAFPRLFLVACRAP